MIRTRAIFISAFSSVSASALLAFGLIAICSGIEFAAAEVTSSGKNVRRRPSSEESGAKNAKKPAAPAAAKKGQTGIVIAQEAAIYENPDLDSLVIALVKQGTKLPISKGTRGTFAKFHRTRVGGKIGWIVVLDVKPEVAAKKFLQEEKQESLKPGPFAEEEAAPSPAKGKGGKKASGKRGPFAGKDEGKSEGEMFVFSRSVSFVVGYLDGYKESIGGADRTDSFLTYGLKMTGPDVFLTGPLMDVNIMFHYGAPAYYNELSATKPSGFMVWTDANLLLPIFMRENALVAIGAGPMLILTNIQADQNGQNYGMWQFNIGGDIELTTGLRFGEFSVRLEGKYIFEKKTYRQVQLAIGTVF